MSIPTDVSKPKTWASIVTAATTSIAKPPSPKHVPKQCDQLDLTTAITNLRAFFDNCPETRIHYVYFICERNKCIPEIKSTFREWFVNKKTVYSIFKPYGWSYTYGLTSIKKLLYVDNTGVVSFQKQPPGAPIQTTSKPIISTTPLQTQLIANLGDHITIGVVNSKDPNDLLIQTHKTYYTQLSTPTIQYGRRAIHCDCLLYAKPIESHLKCIEDKYSMGEKYKDEPLTIPIIQKITNICKGLHTGGATQQRHKNKTSKTHAKTHVKTHAKTHVYNGVHYEVRDGPRNGKYIEIGNTRKYIGGSQKLMYKGIGFDSEGFINYLYNRIFSVVAAQQSGMEGITIIYDEQSYIETDSNKYMCVIYEYIVNEEEERASIYYIDALKAFTSYYSYITPESKRTPNEKTCLQEFNEAIVQHIPQIVVV